MADVKVMEDSKASTAGKAVDEEDDDILLIEDGDDENGQSKTAALNNIGEQIKLVKATVAQTKEEVKLMKKSLRQMEASLGEEIFDKLKHLLVNPECLVHIAMGEEGLQAMIVDVVKELVTPEILDLSRHENQTITRKLDTIENANHAVSKMFLECHGKLKVLGQSLAEESARVNQEIAYYEEMLAQKTINIDDDDDDDDVKIVEDSSSPVKSGTGVAAPSLNIHHYRSQFASAVQSQMPGLLNTLNSQQGAPLAESNSTSALAALMAINQTDKAVVWPTIQAIDKVLGKKFNDVWYPGIVLDVIQPSTQEPGAQCMYKVRFNKGMKMLPGKHIAYKDPLKCVVRVGTRVTALYKEDDAPNTLYAGIIAEAPSFKNRKRFLVFFDDGYAQYCQASEVHKVCVQSDKVWEDIPIETRAFIKDYLDIYPERPMVRLLKGQVVKTEWNGKWWTAKVMRLDASLVKMVFQIDRRTEWIYRGSTRLEPLFRALTNANAIKAARSSRGRRLNLTMKPSDCHRKPEVEYTRGGSIDDEGTSPHAPAPSSSSDKGNQAGIAASKPPMSAGGGASSKQSQSVAEKKKVNVARKSTGGSVSHGTTRSNSSPTVVTGAWEAPWVKYQRKASSAAMPNLDPTSSSLSASITVQSSSSSSSSSPTPTMENRHGLDQDSKTGGQQAAEKGRSVKAGVSRQTTPSSTKKTPDIASVLQERLSFEEVQYDEQLQTGKRRDIVLETKGKRNSQYSAHLCHPTCLEGMEEVLEDSARLKNQNPLLVPLRCQWERQVCKARPSLKRFVVYRGPCGRRLRSIEEVDRYLQTTNSSLGIDLFSFDHNLHVSTEFVPVKTFCDIKDLSYGIENYPISCVNGVDRNYPDYVEYYNYRIPAKGVTLNLNPDFLACCDCTDNCRDPTKCACQQLTIENTSCIGPVDPDAGYHYRRLREPLFTGIFECNSRCACDKRCHNKLAQLGLRMRLQVFRTEKKGWGLRCLDDIAKGSFICIYAGQLLTDKGANEDGKQYGDEYLAELDFMEVVEGQKEGYESGVEFSDNEDDDDKMSNDDDNKDSNDSDFSIDAVIDVGERRKSGRRSAKEKEERGLDPAKQKDKSKIETPGSVESSAISISDDDDDDESMTGEKKQTDVVGVGGEEEAMDAPGTSTTADKELRRRAKKSTAGLRLNLAFSAMKGNDPMPDETGEKATPKKPERLPTRSYFGDQTECYIMDAKSMGNLGRYLNHSCSPNVFVQNIFVDTHDLRFPWVAFFAGEYIRAGTELTWDYNYEVGSVPDKILYCYCGSSMCRGRLL